MRSSASRRPPRHEARAPSARLTSFATASIPSRPPAPLVSGRALFGPTLLLCCGVRWVNPPSTRPRALIGHHTSAPQQHAMNRARPSDESGARSDVCHPGRVAARQARAHPLDGVVTRRALAEQRQRLCAVALHVEPLLELLGEDEVLIFPHLFFSRRHRQADRRMVGTCVTLTPTVKWRVKRCGGGASQPQATALAACIDCAA